LLRTFTKVLAVPKSIPISWEKSPRRKFNGLNTNAPSLV
jgi:hypothetical protein